MEMKKGAKSPVSQGQFIKRMATAVIFINLFVIALAGLSLRQSLLQHEERAVVTAQNLSQVLERYIGGVIDKIDVTLLAISDEIEKQVAVGGIKGQKLNRFIVRQHARLPELDGLRMADAQGNIICGTGVTPGLKANIANREYFVHLRENAKAKLVISKPVVSRVTGEWVVLLARRLNKPDGSFSGVVYGVITLESFIKVFASIDVGKHGTIALYNEELDLVARRADPAKVDSAIGQKTVSPEFFELVKAGMTKGTFHAFSKVDKVERTMSFRRIAGYALYIITGLSTSDYLTGWRDEALKTSVIVALFFLATLCLSWLGYRDWMRGKAAVRTMKENLEALVQERTAELVVATDRAEAASRAKSNFLSSVSHELRTPMTSIFGFAKLIKNKMEEDMVPRLDPGDKKAMRSAQQIRSNLDIIVSEGERLTKLINDVLDLAKLDAGRVEWHFDKTDLPEIVNHVVTLSKQQVESKGLSISVEVSSDLPPIAADRDRILQVLLNLISNAVKFTERGGITIGACLHDREIIFSVGDTGIGIDADDQDKVFDKFQQIGDTLTAKPHGTGLGLAICREIINRHGGRIWVESEHGKGSIFRFVLPLTSEKFSQQC
ncbi:MAG: hypothetical protein HQL09_10565 [Nitrospirae bacterium]|nr:hypothetical protein [Nitrospirota bacterium]